MKLAEENRDWGYKRMQGALENLGHAVACSTIGKILERKGLEPAPERKRKTTWKEFLTQHCVNELSLTERDESALELSWC